MIRKTIAAWLAALLAASLSQAQAPQFHWNKGQVLVYRVKHATKTSFAKGDTKSETSTNLALIKRWQVVDVDATGIATLQLSLSALSYETHTPAGESLAFDSEHPEKSSEPIRKQFVSFIGQPLVVLRIDSQGKVIEMKESKGEFASAAKYESDPPFKLWLPAEALREGGNWQREYAIVLEPPQGTGEKYPAVQRFTCKSLRDNLATLSLTTELRKTPEAREDQMPLWQAQPEGEIVFDVQAGRLQKATLRMDKEEKDLPNEEGSMHFESSYQEEYIGDR